MEQRRYFITIARELNISKAAQQLFVSQQSLSAYLKKLEEYYGVTLIQRKPKMMLTSAGRALLEAYLRMDNIERTVYSEITEIIKGAKGSISIGIHSSRSTLLLPEIIEKFHERYPYISFYINDGVTKQFEDALLEGKIDMFIGLRPSQEDVYKAQLLREEKLYLAITDGMIKKNFGDDLEYWKKRFSEGISLRECEDLPFIMQNDESRIAKLIERVTEKNNIKLWARVKSNNGTLRLSLAQKGLGAAFCAQMRIKAVNKLNQSASGDSHLNIFPVSDLEDTFDTYLVYKKFEYMPEYFQYFVDLTLQYFNNDMLDTEAD